MAGAAYVTVQKIFEWPILAGGIAAAVLVAFAFMLYALPLYRRAQRSARLSVGLGTGAIAGRR
jgi:Na+-transporting NADH:ubiquinone oxidoreductase subunit NqrB